MLSSFASAAAAMQKDQENDCPSGYFNHFFNRSLTEFIIFAMRNLSWLTSSTILSGEIFIRVIMEDTMAEDPYP